MKHYLTIVFCLMTALTMNAQALTVQLDKSDILITDFEGNSYAEWKIEGDAFAANPLPTSALLGWGDNGFEGKNMATSYTIGDAGVGSFTSPEFIIKRKYLNFLIGGGADMDRVYIALFVDGKEVKRSAGNNRRVLDYECWDVKAYKGKKAQIKMVDNSKDGWGFINADFFFQSDNKKEKEVISRKLTITSNFLNFPVRTGALTERLELLYKGALLHDMEIELDGDRPDFWVSLHCEQWKGKELEFRIPDNGKVKEGMNQIYQSDSPNGQETFYKESLRPKFHFTSQRGWLNDPNGLVWYAGEWHLFYQHNPYGFNWNNMTWGHAVSPDLVHWKELGDALHPDEWGPMFSGSAVVDKNNTLGVKGPEETLVAIYTSAGGVGFRTRHLQHSQSIAYSTDKGRTWVKYAKNPVIPTITKYNRDPKVIWHEPSRKWVMALYLDKQEYILCTSSDLKNWTEVDRFVLEGADECPDFFDMPVQGNLSKSKWVFTGANSTYLVGDFDGKHFVPQTKPLRMDNGTNYYAVQTYSNAPDNRRIQVAWMNGSVFHGMPFNQQMSFPRELTLHEINGEYVLKSMPVREIENLYKGKHEWKNVTVDASSNITSSFRNPVFHLKSTFNINQSHSEAFGFNIDGFIVKYQPRDEKLIVSLQNGNPIREFKVSPVNGSIELDILSDIGSIEVFVNQGEVSGAFYYLPECRDGNVKLFSNGSVLLENLIIHDLKAFWEL